MILQRKDNKPKGSNNDQINRQVDESQGDKDASEEEYEELKESAHVEKELSKINKESTHWVSILLEE